MMIQISISQAKINDAQAILELQKLAYQSEAKRYNDYKIPPLTQTLEEIKFEFESHYFLKAVYERQIVGSVRGKVKFKTLMIGRLIVHPDFQKQGIGTKLMYAIEGINEPIERYELFTGNKSLKNISLYERLGYVLFQEEVVSSHLSLVYMEKIK